jgi:hypothetical protein
MPSSPKDISPTDSAARENRETSSNGFTAVNGRGTPPQAAKKPARPGNEGRPVNGDGRPKSQNDHPPTGEDLRRLENADIRQSVSPLNTPGKRKRTESAETDDDDDDEVFESESPEGTNEQMDYSHDVDGDSNYGRHHDDSSEVQLVEALQREAGANGYSRPMGGPVNGISSSEDFVTTKAGVQVNPTKRKRVSLYVWQPVVCDA